MSDNKIAIDLQNGYDQIKELFGGKFHIVLESDYNKKFHGINYSGKKQNMYDEIKDLFLIEVEGILWKEKDEDLNSNAVYKSYFAMDVIDVLNSGLDKYYNEKLYVVSLNSRIKNVQIYNLGQDTIYTIPGPIKDGSEGYDVIFFEATEIVQSGR